MKKESILKSVLFISVFTLIIKILGLVKQIAISSYYGANLETDVFYISTGVIGQLAALIYSALSVSLLTMYAKKKEIEGKKKANSLIFSVLKVYIPITSLFVIILIFLAPVIANFLASSYNQEEMIILIKYIRVVSLSFIPWCYYLTINVVLEENKKFIPGRCQIFFQNLFIIIACIILSNKHGALALVYAFLLSGVAESILVTICARKELCNYEKNIDNKSEIKKLILLSLPLMIGNAAAELNDIVDKKIATGVGIGNASLLTYSATLNEMITGIVISSLSIVLFSHFSTWVAKKEMDRIDFELKRVISFLITFLIPIIIIFSLFGNELVHIMYGNGRINNENLEKIYLILIGYALGFVFQATRIIFAKTLYAFQDTKSPMINGIISITMNVFLSIFLAKKIGISGISIATTISMLFASLLLLKALKKHLPNFRILSIKKETIKNIVSGILTVFILFGIKEYLFINNIIMRFAIESFLCIIIYFVLLILMKSDNVDYIIKKAKKIFTHNA